MVITMSIESSILLSKANVSLDKINFLSGVKSMLELTFEMMKVKLKASELNRTIIIQESSFRFLLDFLKSITFSFGQLVYWKEIKNKT